MRDDGESASLLVEGSNCWRRVSADRAKPTTMLREVCAHRSRTARAASDHLPVVATVDLRAEGAV
jgi:hypothetical protein